MPLQIPVARQGDLLPSCFPLTLCLPSSPSSLCLQLGSSTRVHIRDALYRLSDDALQRAAAADSSRPGPSGEPVGSVHAGRNSDTKALREGPGAAEHRSLRSEEPTKASGVSSAGKGAVGASAKGDAGGTKGARAAHQTGSASQSSSDCMQVPPCPCFAPSQAPPTLHESLHPLIHSCPLPFLAH